MFVIRERLYAHPVQYFYYTIKVYNLLLSLPKMLVVSMVQFPFDIVIITGFMISVLTSPNVSIYHHLGPHVNIN